MFFMYKSYPCAPKATLLSGLCSMGEILALIFAAFFVGMYRKEGGAMYHSAGAIIGAIVLVVFAVVCYLYVYRKLVPKMAETETERNVRTKANFANIYCQSHPEAFDELREINADFAAKYMRDENGRIVKIKNK